MSVFGQFDLFFFFGFSGGLAKKKKKNHGEDVGSPALFFTRRS